MPMAAQTLSQIKQDRGYYPAIPDNRPSPSVRGYGSKWQKVRKAYLVKHPLCECEDCKRLGLIKASQVVDHKTPHKGDMVLFWDKSNWQAMAKSCHDRKTAKEDGGFGHERR